MALDLIVNGGSGLECLTRINAAITAIDALGTPTTAGIDMLTAADAIAQAALIGSNGGNGSADAGLAATYNSVGELTATESVAARVPNYNDFEAGLADGLAACILSSFNGISFERYVGGALFSGLITPASLSAGRTWTLPDASGALLVTGDIGVSVQAYSSALVTLAAKSLSGSGNLACVTSPSFTTPILGTPASGTLTNCTGLPAAAVTGLGTMATQAANSVAITGGTASLASMTLPTVYFKDVGANTVALRDLADAAYANLTLGRIQSYGQITIGSAGNASPTALIYIGDYSTAAGSAAQIIGNRSGSYYWGLGLNAGTGGGYVKLGGCSNAAGAWASDATFGLLVDGAIAIGALDTQINRAAAAVMQLGVNHATTATKQTLKSHNVTTGTGATLCLAGGTGSVAGGAIEFATSATTGAPVVRMTIKANGNINASLPTSSAGLSAGDLWNNGGVVTVV